MSTGTSAATRPRRSSRIAQRLLEQGFTALRFGPQAAFDDAGLASWDPQRSIVATIAATESLRDALGDGVDLLLDAHTMFSPAESAYLGHALEPCRLFFYEDPIRPLNPQSLRLVREKVNLPLATGEQLAHKWEFAPLIEEELIDYLRVDVVHAGGITEATKILAMGEAHGQRSALHHASSPVNRGRACTSTSPCGRGRGLLMGARCPPQAGVRASAFAAALSSDAFSRLLSMQTTPHGGVLTAVAARERETQGRVDELAELTAHVSAATGVRRLLRRRCRHAVSAGAACGRGQHAADQGARGGS